MQIPFPLEMENGFSCSLGIFELMLTEYMREKLILYKSKTIKGFEKQFAYLLYGICFDYSWNCIVGMLGQKICRICYGKLDTKVSREGASLSENYSRSCLFLCTLKLPTHLFFSKY